MSWMQFTLEAMDRLIWPLAILAVLLLMRRPMAQLIPLAKRFKFQGLEVEFQQELRAASLKAKAAFPELIADRKCLLLSSADHLPNASLLEAWQAVDEAAEVVVRQRRLKVDLNSETRYKDIESVLVAQGLIDTKKAKLFSELRQLRNKVAHARGFVVGKAAAMQYIELCFRLVDHLERLQVGVIEGGEEGEGVEEGKGDTAGVV
ncbi:hypothetical protein [Marinobacter sp. SS21]|uniref:hypothetical protein n=1 Tax=Marinobacter sp. SS21 TaxID=2979460 RepID=UPI002330593C|nr:hypothetical protein [Marinobacter sp. SS21]MDC0662080.1 hypothetical protein [Marinobacter sp. SS21]